MKSLITTIGLLLLVALVLPSNVSAEGKMIEVKITNLSAKVVLTPPIVAASKRQIKVFQLTKPASLALEMLAEDEKRATIKLILLDIRLITPSNRDTWKQKGKRAGIDLARMILQQLEYDIPIICYTANLHSDISTELKKIGVAEIIEKGGSIRDLKIIIWKHLNKKTE